MHTLRKIFIFAMVYPAVGYITIFFCSLFLEPISWLAEFDYDLWDSLVFLSNQPPLPVYLASCAVGWFTMSLLPSFQPIYVVNHEER
ncbi:MULTISPECIES: hypothetical protein [unclassified Neptuniibacter]|uniref:hypothetical protein n=1 Tax=unclassified Neptuniibacter TaxID=2630693 RepID=UPI0025E7B0FC|nr:MULTISPECIES: hypothetical protein [unclassified Neptuniibacter]